MAADRTTSWIIAISAFAVTVGIGAAVISRAPSKPVLAAAAAPVKPAGQRITVPTLGLTLVKPDDWVTISAEQNANNLARVRMDDPEFQALAARYAAVPVIAIAKHPEPYDDLNPSVKINVRPAGAFAGSSPEEILNAVLPLLARPFHDLEVQSPPTRTTLSGKNAAYARVSYTLRAGGSSFPTVSEFWIVPKGSVFFMIGAGTRADERTGSRSEVRSIVDNIVIE